MAVYPKIQLAGENSVVVYFAATTSVKVSAQVQQYAKQVGVALGGALVDMVPSYASLLVIYNPLQIDHLAVEHRLAKLLSSIETNNPSQGKLITLPVYYSEESGPDLATLAAQKQLTIDELITIHQQQEYRVYAIGFAPGFAYLGEVDERIAAARLATPRLKVPKGAVGIADRQTAIYPAESPGGWNLIGLCPTPMFTPNAEPIMPVVVGDRVTFSAIDRDEYLALGGEL